MARRHAASLKGCAGRTTFGHQTAMNDVLSRSGTGQARLIRDGQVSSAELVDAHLERIEQINPGLNAAIEVLAESARTTAGSLDRQRAQGAQLGPLAGVPFSIKDSIEVAGTVCTAGTIGLQSAPASTRDATLVARFRSPG